MMNAEDVTRVFQDLEDALHKIEDARDDVEQYTKRSEVLVELMQVARDQIDAGDPRLATLGNKLSKEFIYASKSAELRSPFLEKSKERTYNSKY
ncbi:hypothetical protein [Planktotalea sp.]|uniref:hypothetical protein n=1 Tax=Planktotalea sp. TaxID=2029877 RepID=UPI003F6A9585